MKYLIIGMILLLITGCSMFGIEFGTHRTLTVEKSPYRVTLSGDVQKDDYKAAKAILQFLSHKRYRNHKFEPIKVEVYGSQSTKHIDLLDVDKSQETKEGE